MTSSRTPEVRRPPSAPVLRIRVSIRRRWLALATTACGLGGLAVLVATGLTLLAVTRYGPAVLTPWTSPWLAASSLLLTIGGLALLRAAWLESLFVSPTRTGLIHQLHPRGLRWRPDLLSWEDIRAIHTGTVRYGLGRWTWGRRTRLRLVDQRGRSLRLPTSLSGLDRVAAHIKARAYPALLSYSRERFNRGERLAFGPLRLDRSGLTIRGRSVAWEDLQSAAVDGGILRLAIRRGRRTHTLHLPVWKVANLDLCLNILQHLGRHP